MATQNPFASYNEFTPQVQGLERQRKMAELLMQQGMQAPQGQMVSGRYVAPSWTQHLAQLGNAALGAYGMSEADKEQKLLAGKYQEASQQELANFLRAKQGTPAQEAVMGSSPAITGDNAGDVEAQAGGFYGNAPTQPLQGARAAIPAQPGLDRLSLALLASKAQYNPMLPTLGAELMKQEFKEPDWVASTRYDSQGREVHGWVNKNSPNPEETFRGGSVKPALTQAQIIELKDKGIDVSAYTGGQTGGQAVGGQPPSQTTPKFTPTGNQKEFYNSMYSTALQQAKAMGAPNPEALATLAATQSSIETGGGRALAGGNNYFGIKGGNNPQQTKEWDPATQSFKTITSSFRQYKDMNQSVGDYLNLLKNNYPLAFNAKSPEEAFVGITSKNPQGLKYMTDPGYLGKLQAYNASIAGGQTTGGQVGGQTVGQTTPGQNPPEPPAYLTPAGKREWLNEYAKKQLSVSPEESKLRNDFIGETKTHNEVVSAWQKIQTAPKSAAGDMSLVFGYMKILDPSSTVREGEYATAKNAAGVPDQIRNTWNKVKTGEFLTDAQREDFRKSASDLVKSQQTVYKDIEKAYTKRAENYGIKPENVIRNPYESFKPVVAPPKAGEVVDGFKFKGGNPADKNNWIKVQ